MSMTIKIRLKSVGETYRISQAAGIARLDRPIFLNSVNHKSVDKLIYVLMKQ